MQSQPVPGYNPYNPQQPPSQIHTPPNHSPYSVDGGSNDGTKSIGAHQQYPYSDSIHQNPRSKKRTVKVSQSGKKYLPIFFALILAALISSGSTFFLMGGNLFTTPTEFEGKWYSGSSGGHIYLQEDGTLKEWESIRFECYNGQTVSGSYVNDGDNDCSDGSDEDSNRANNFNPEYGWEDFSAYADRYSTASATWSVVDEMICFQYSISYPGKYSGENIQCAKAEVKGNALWIADDDINEFGEIEECSVMLKLGNRESGPQEWSQNWVDTWNFALEDVYSERPSFCQSTPFDRLEQEYYW